MLDGAAQWPKDHFMHSTFRSNGEWEGGGGSPQPPSREKSVCMSEREKCVCVSARERENTGRQICRWAEYGCGGG